MTLKQAERIIEDFENACISYDECAGEAGMGAVSMGWDGNDGMAVYHATHSYPTEGPREIEAFAVRAMFSDLEVRTDEDYGLFGVRFDADCIVPEFYPVGHKPADTDSIPF